jgi:hypothetical protein
MVGGWGRQIDPGGRGGLTDPCGEGGLTDSLRGRWEVALVIHAAGG